jgi:hypothetical protein
MILATQLYFLWRKAMIKICSFIGFAFVCNFQIGCRAIMKPFFTWALNFDNCSISTVSKISYYFFPVSLIDFWASLDPVHLDL